ncbi:MAG TPA: H-NS histone family protein [Methylococcaceae bacterium]|jgi:DNA-binding protein H-NS|nr:H-NS histone family protein [Methylococcaceae bacterium]HIN68054.1 H-NS histone family protein [Methylococcales bacterium]HIA46207.1 H-NS histone family protein [Methylococcaceae bacterium]HIB63505.1 H-NS histone family protein [Methylococcaceae bacterium]HIO12372.1 H-NS histone family protein [Methylococcales bacterium]
MSDYNNLSEDELESVIAQAQQTLIEKKNNRRKEVIAEIKALAASINLTVDIIDDTKKHPSKNAKIAAKYRNPQDSSQTWSGRGLTPKWMQALLTSGYNKNDLEI